MVKGYKKDYSSLSKKNDLISIRGYSCILATCDVAREKEGTKELVNLISQTIDELYPNDDNDNIKISGNTIEEMLAEEIKNSSIKQSVISINSGVKGLVLVKIAKANVCPIKLVRYIFSKIESTHLPCTRHLCRIVPLTKVFFANEAEFITNLQALIAENFSDSSSKDEENINVVVVENQEEEVVNDEPVSKKIKYETIDSSLNNSEITSDSTNDNNINSTTTTVDINIPTIQSETNTNIDSKKTPYESLLPISFLFKRRNHNTLSRIQTQQIVFNTMPRSKCRVDFKNPKAVFVVELFMNTCGISFVNDFDTLTDFNISKHQKIHCLGENNKNNNNDDGAGAGDVDEQENEVSELVENDKS